MSLSPTLAVSVKTSHAVVEKCQEHIKSAGVYTHEILLMAVIATLSSMDIPKVLCITLYNKYESYCLKQQKKSPQPTTTHHQEGNTHL